MRVVVIGVGGQVGNTLANQHVGLGDTVHGTHYMNEDFIARGFWDSQWPTARLDISDYREVKNYFSNIASPDIIYLPAAITNVDACEKYPEETYKTNVLGVHNIVNVVKGCDARVVFYSTDFVFDGLTGCYSEDDVANPINEYGWQKLRAEHIVATTLRQYYIIRTNVVYGKEPQGKNYIVRVVDNLRKGNIVKAAVDEWSTPTYVSDLAWSSIWLAKSGLTNGIYNIGGPQLCNRYKFTLLAARAFKCDERLVQPVKSQDLGRTALRPLNAGLRTRDMFKVSSCEDGLADMYLKEEGSKND